MADYYLKTDNIMKNMFVVSLAFLYYMDTTQDL